MRAVTDGRRRKAKMHRTVTMQRREYGRHGRRREIKERTDAKEEEVVAESKKLLQSQ